MKFVKVLLIIATVLALLFGMVWQFWLKDQVALADIGTSFTAKHLCSCIFIAERTLESCKTDSLTDISQLSFERTEDGVTASVLGGLVSNTAKFEEGLGCSLVVN